MQVLHYVNGHGRDVYQDWFTGLRDRQGRIAILRRIDRLEHDKPGDHAYCRDGVWEMRIDHGPGYRVYFGKDGSVVVVLLGGGDKASQARDIDKAVEAWRDYLRRK